MCARRQCGNALRTRGGRGGLAEIRHHELGGIARQRRTVQHHRQPHTVVVGVAYQNAAEQARTILADDEFLVHLLTFVHERVCPCVLARRVRVAE